MSTPAPRRTAVLAAVIAVSALLPLVAAPVAGTGGSSFTTVVNRYRAAAGLSPVSLNAKLDTIAVERAKQLAAKRTLNHDFDYLKKRLAELNVCWQQLGEIVAWNSSGDYGDFGRQWYNSDPHRAIMLGSGYTHVGGSRAQGGDGRYYAVMVFARLCGASSSTTTTTSGFVDISSSPFKADIEWLVARKITKGCDATHYCPRAAVTREQMASFLKRAMGLGAAARDWFRDDETSAHEDDINRIADAGVTKGCDAKLYCPRSRVNRAQMASFLVRALGLRSTSRDYFWDDNSSPHEDAINRVAAAGITSGCGGGKYCPGGTVTREQMAAFIRRAFD